MKEKEKKKTLRRYLGKLPSWFDLRKKALLEDKIDIDRWAINMEYLETKDLSLRQKADHLVVQIDDGSPFLPPVLMEKQDRNWFIAAYPDVIDYFYPTVALGLGDRTDTARRKMAEVETDYQKLKQYLSSKKLNQTLTLLHMKRFYKDELKKCLSLTTE
jgi:hypothetical protein